LMMPTTRSSMSWMTPMTPVPQTNLLTRHHPRRKEPRRVSRSELRRQRHQCSLWQMAKRNFVSEKAMRIPDGFHLINHLLLSEFSAAFPIWHQLRKFEPIPFRSFLFCHLAPPTPPCQCADACMHAMREST
jgi:hypothetical protein